MIDATALQEYRDLQNLEKVRETPEFNEILTNPNLLEIISQELDKKIVDEKPARECIFICACGRNVENPSDPSSFNLLVHSESGAGKDYVCTKTLSILPESEYLKRSRISPTAFTYWKANDTTWTWDKRVCYLEDVSNNVLNSEVLKVMASTGNKKATIVVNQKATDIEVKGKPVLILTSYSANPSKETLRRFPILGLDETEDQTKAINDRHAEYAEQGKSVEYDPKVKEALSLLNRVKVRVPYAKQIVAHLPTNHVIMRTVFNRFLDYIKASAALHQYQRAKDGEGYVLSNDKDYDIARRAILKITSNSMMVPLDKKKAKIIKIFKSLIVNGERGFYSVSDLEKNFSFSGKTLREHLDGLTEIGFLVKESQERSTSKKPVMVYQVREIGNLELPTSKDLQISSFTSFTGFDSNDSFTSFVNQNSGTKETKETKEVKIEATKETKEGNESKEAKETNEENLQLNSSQEVPV